MKICIIAKGPSPLSEMDGDFEKCAYFTFFIYGSMGFEATANDGDNNPEQLLINKGVKVLITKKIGLKSLTILNNANIEVFTGSSELISEVLIRFRKGELKPTRKTDISSNFEIKEK